VFLSSAPRRILAYNEPVDMRKYAGSVVMRSVETVSPVGEATARDSLRITPAESK